jgi:hypothetical protein
MIGQPQPQQQTQLEGAGRVRRGGWPGGMANGQTYFRLR